MRKIVAMAAMTAVLVGALLGPATTSAHADAVYHGNDTVRVSADHMTGAVCDAERDGHYVYGAWITAAGDEVAEIDGGDAGCDYVSFNSPAISMLICEENKGCRQEQT